MSDSENRAELEARVTALLLGELSAEDAAALRQIISQDAALKQLHERLRLTLDLVRETTATSAGEISEQTAPLRLSPARREALLAHFKTVAPKELARPRARRVSLLVELAAVAAIVLIAAGLILPRLGGVSAKAKNKNAALTFATRYHLFQDGQGPAEPSSQTTIKLRAQDGVLLADGPIASGSLAPGRNGTGTAAQGTRGAGGRRGGGAPPAASGDAVDLRRTRMLGAAARTAGTDSESAKPPAMALTAAASANQSVQGLGEPESINLLSEGAGKVAAKPGLAQDSGKKTDGLAGGNSAASLPKTFIYTGKTEESANGGSAEQGIALNLRGTSVDQALSFLAESSGLTINRLTDTQHAGYIDLVSDTPLNKDDTLRLLNKKLADRGLAAVQDKNTLTVMSSQAAHAHAGTPVTVPTTWADIPEDSQIVTEEIPVRTLNPKEVAKELYPVLPPGAKMSTSEAGNAVAITGTQEDVKRTAQVINALDSTGNGNLDVFPLTYANAKDIASELKDVLNTQNSAGGTNGNPSAAVIGGRGGSGGGGADASRRTGVHVNAVADEQNNAVLISAPRDFMPAISNAIAKLDIPQEDTTQTRLYFLTNADSTATANELQRFFAGTAQPAGSASSSANGGPQKPGVVAVADPRTQSVLVTAPKDTMDQIEKIVDDWDSIETLRPPTSVNGLADDGWNATLPADLLAHGGGASGASGQQSALQERMQQAATQSTVAAATSIGSGGGAGGSMSGTGMSDRRRGAMQFGAAPSSGGAAGGRGGGGGGGVAANSASATQGQVGPVTFTDGPSTGEFRL